MTLARTDPVVEWLLQSTDPSVRYFVLVDLLGRSTTSREVKVARAEILDGPRVRKLLGGQKKDGGFGVHPYQKWTGAHWRLVSLVELGVTDDLRAHAAAGTVLEWLTSDEHRRRIPRVKGLYRAHASMEGNALAVCSRLGLAKDPRVKQLAESLLEWQWPDGGWN